jgi:sulfite exporter TauE/SafE
MIYTALLLGVTGSLHCLAMCSPLSMIVSNTPGNQLLNRLVYHSGRILTYALLGAGAASISAFVPIASHQTVLSIGLGIVLIMIALSKRHTFHVPYLTCYVSHFTTLLKTIFGKYVKQKNYFAKFLLGIINGFLPCGLTLMALTICITLPNAMDGLWYMFFFGVGTLPMLLGAHVVLLAAFKKFNCSASSVMMILLIISGALLITRGFIEHHHEKHASDTMNEIICD